MTCRQWAPMPIQQSCYLTTIMMTPQMPCDLVFAGVFSFFRAPAAKHNEPVHDTFMTGMSVNLTITPPCYHHYGPLDAPWTLFAGFFLSRERWQQPAHNMSPASKNTASATMPARYHHDDPSDAPWAHICEFFHYPPSDDNTQQTGTRHICNGHWCHINYHTTLLSSQQPLRHPTISHLQGYFILYALAITWQTGTRHIRSRHKCQIGCHTTSPSPSRPLHHQNMHRKTKNDARIATGHFSALQWCRTQSGASSTQYWSHPTARESCKTPWSVSSL